MAKHVTGIRHTIVQAFKSATINRLQRYIEFKKASISSKYTIFLLISTNDIDFPRTIGEIMSYFENLITFIKSNSSSKIIVLAIIPRPCEMHEDPTEGRVKNMNKEQKQLCKRRNLQFLHTFRMFLHNYKPIRSHFAVNDQDLHLNLEGTRKLRRFSISTVAHLK